MGHQDRRVSCSARAGIELATGVGLLSAVVMFGVVVSNEHRATQLDRWGFALVQPGIHDVLWQNFVKLGSPLDVLLAVAAISLWAVRRSRPRALMCLVSPLAAGALAQLAKVVFDRRLDGVASYPSGTVATIAAIATVLVVLAPPEYRATATVGAAAIVVAVGCAVVALHWHYPTDALFGVALGAGVVLVADAVAHEAGRAGTRRTAVALTPVAGRR